MLIRKICVIGLGYIGLPTACMFANNQIMVVGVDINKNVLRHLQNGHIHIVEDGLQNFFESAIRSGNLVVQEKPEPADAFIIAVPTPILDDKKADMRYVESAARSILPYLKKGDLVVLESTSPPMTTLELVLPILEQTGLKVGKDLLLAYSPERVLPGKILVELVNNARVIGGFDQKSAVACKDLYQTFVEGEIILTDSSTAELVKLMENTYRDVNIAVANEFSRLANRFHVDVWEAIQIANLHPRVKILNPGPGVGGHCISVDPWFLVEKAPDLSKLIHTARLVNDSQPAFVVEKVIEILGDIRNKKIGVLGLSYKPDVDDIRESPAIKVVELLNSLGAEVKVYEPFRSDQVEGVDSVNEINYAIEDVDLILVLVGHSKFKHLDPNLLPKDNGRLVLDTVNIIPPSWKMAGYKVYHLGNGHEFSS